MTDTQTNYAAYKQHAEKVAARFEERRAVFMERFKFRLIVSAIILLSLPFLFTYMAGWNVKEASLLSGLGQTVVNILAALVIIVFVMIYAMLPLFRYRNYTMQYGALLPGMESFAQQHVSLKSEIFSQLLGFFGKFTLHSERKLALKKFHNAPNMPNFDEFISEDYIAGRINNVQVEMTEARLVTKLHKADVTIFNGLMIILQLDDPEALRAHFAGQTVIVGECKQGMQPVISKYASFKRMPISNAALQSRFEVFTTDAEESEKLIKPEMLNAILSLSEGLRNSKQQYLSLDERVSSRLGKLAHGMADVLALAAERLILWLQTGSLRMVSTRHAMTFPDAIGDDAKALNQCVHAVFYEDKLILTVPYSQNLFEPDSLLSPPLNPNDIELVYQLMTSISTIIDNTLPALKA